MKSMADALTEALQKRMSQGGKITITFDSEKMGLAPDTKEEGEEEKEESPAYEMAEDIVEEKPEVKEEISDLEKAIMGGEDPEKLMQKGESRTIGQKAALAVAKKKVKA